MTTFQGTGQRVQMLTFSGNVKVCHRLVANSSNGVVTLNRSYRQQFSGDSATDWLGPRDDSSPTKNGHFTITFP
jgi:hypothetical protein